MSEIRSQINILQHIICFTSTRDPISSESSNTLASETSLSVVANSVCAAATIVGQTFIDIWLTQHKRTIQTAKYLEIEIVMQIEIRL